MADGEGNGPYRGPAREAPYALSRLSGPVSLVDVARQIEQADAFLASTTSARLELIAQQMQALREAARAVLEKAELDAELHRVDARFKRYPGRTYHLYQRATGERYWSLLSPAEWGGAAPHAFLGSYRLESDQSFTRLDPAGDAPEPNKPRRLVRGDLP
jgi:alkylation response protein AidB-like acyl-CoA dehydrogenase